MRGPRLTRSTTTLVVEPGRSEFVLEQALLLEGGQPRLVALGRLAVVGSLVDGADRVLAVDGGALVATSTSSIRSSSSAAGTVA